MIEKFSNDSASVDENGFLIIDSVLASESVLDYYDEDSNLFRVYMPGDALEKALNQFVGVPLTNDHPEDGVINNRNFQKYAVGYVSSDLKFENGLLKGKVAVCQDSAIKEVLGQDKTDLSIGYYRDFKKEPGIFVDTHGTMGEPGKEYPYDLKYENIILNHLAICEQGRSKAAEFILDSIDYTIKEASISLDAEHFRQDIKKIMKIENEDKTQGAAESTDMKSYDSMKAEYDAMKSECDSLKAELAAMKASKDEALVAMDSQNIKIQELEATVSGLKISIEQKMSNDSANKVVESEISQDSSEEAIKNEVEARLKTWEEIGGTNNNLVPFNAALDSAGIKRAFLLAQTTDEALKAVINDSSDAFVDGLFFGADKKQAKKATQLIDDNRKASQDSAKVVTKGYGLRPDGSFGFIQ